MSEDSSLWAWSVRVYGQPGVREVCLHLQDGFGLDVDVTLACAWAATRGHELNEADLDVCLSVSAELRGRVQRIRAVRREVHGESAAEAFYEALLHAELQGEEMVLRALHEWIDAHASQSGSTARGRARATLQRYAILRRAWPACTGDLERFIDLVLAEG